MRGNIASTLKRRNARYSGKSSSRYWIFIPCKFCGSRGHLSIVRLWAHEDHATPYLVAPRTPRGRRIDSGRSTHQHRGPKFGARACVPQPWRDRQRVTAPSQRGNRRFCWPLFPCRFRSSLMPIFDRRAPIIYWSSNHKSEHSYAAKVPGATGGA
jgi:hypothetical protein